MPPPVKIPIPGKAKKKFPDNNRVFIIEKDTGITSTEIDLEIDIETEGTYSVVKLSTANLDKNLTNPDGTTGPSITWLNNFEIRENNSPINKAYKIKVPGLSAMLAGGKQLVIQDGNRNNSKPYIHNVTVANDTFDFSDGDPAVGSTP